MTNDSAKTYHIDKTNFKSLELAVITTVYMFARLKFDGFSNLHNLAHFNAHNGAKMYYVNVRKYLLNIYEKLPHQANVLLDMYFDWTVCDPSVRDNYWAVDPYTTNESFQKLINFRISPAKTQFFQTKQPEQAKLLELLLFKYLKIGDFLRYKQGYTEPGRTFGAGEMVNDPFGKITTNYMDDILKMR